MRKGLVSLTLLTLITFSFGSELTLNKAIETALKNNYQLKASEKALKSKEYQFKSTKGLRFPVITFSEVFMRTNNPGWGMMNTLNQKRLDMIESSKFVNMQSFGFPPPTYPEINNWQTKIEFQLPIYTGGKISTGIKMQKKEYEASKYDFERTKQKVIYDVTKAYYGALLAKRAIQLAKQAYKSVEKHYNTAKSMYDNGLAIYSDVLRAKVYLMDVKNKITEAENQYLVAKRGLLLAMGINNIDPSEIEIVGELKFEDTDKTVDYFQNYALNNRPDLIALRERVENAKRMIDFSKSDFLPTVGAFGSYELNDRKNPFGTDGRWWTVGIALNWKIFDGFQNINKYKSAKEMYKQYKHQKKGFEEYIKFLVYKAYSEFQTAREKLNTAKQNLKWAEEVLKITEKRYKNQMASMIDLLDTQTMYDKISFDLAKAVYDAQLSLLELKYQSGFLKREKIGGDK
ncbi:TolC family protein [Persephonella sp.]